MSMQTKKTLHIPNDTTVIGVLHCVIIVTRVIMLCGPDEVSIKS